MSKGLNLSLTFLVLDRNNKKSNKREESSKKGKKAWLKRCWKRCQAYKWIQEHNRAHIRFAISALTVCSKEQTLCQKSCTFSEKIWSVETLVLLSKKLTSFFKWRSILKARHNTEFIYKLFYYLRSQSIFNLVCCCHNCIKSVMEKTMKCLSQPNVS